MKPRYPGWRYGPNGEAEIFQCAEDVPEGWYDTPQEAVARAKEYAPPEEKSKRGRPKK